jgi:hypothetical protein
MCWSFEVSVLTGLISYSIALYIWLRNIKNDRWHSILLFTFSTIQWMDAILWKSKESSKLSLMTITYFIPFILALEPVSSLYGAYYTNKKVDKSDMILYLFVFLGLFITLSKGAQKTGYITKEGIRYSIDQGIVSYWIYAFLLLYPFIKYSTANIFYMITTVVICFGLFIAQMTSPNTVGSHWCLYGNVASLLFLFYPYIDQYFNMHGA